jgi:hypothetical protein
MSARGTSFAMTLNCQPNLTLLSHVPVFDWPAVRASRRTKQTACDSKNRCFETPSSCTHAHLHRSYGRPRLQAEALATGSEIAWRCLHFSPPYGYISRVVTSLPEVLRKSGFIAVTTKDLHSSHSNGSLFSQTLKARLTLQRETLGSCPTYLVNSLL